VQPYSRQGHILKLYKLNIFAALVKPYIIYLMTERLSEKSSGSDLTSVISQLPSNLILVIQLMGCNPIEYVEETDFLLFSCDQC